MPIPEHIRNNPVYYTVWLDVYKRDLDALIAVTGRRGHCKSGFAQHFGLQMDWDVRKGKTRFSLDNIFFKAEDFLAAMQSNKPKGTVFIWDEVGVENDSRSWYEQKNKMIKYVMETNRYKNYIVLVTLPVLTSMDISTQRLLSAYVEMRGKTGDGDSARGKWEFVETNPKTGKKYYKMPRFIRNGRVYKMTEMVVPRPPKEFEGEYFKKKKYFTDNLYSFIEGEMKYMGRMLGKSKRPDMQALENYVVENVEQFYDYDKEKWEEAGFRAALGLKTTQAKELRANLAWKLKKGLISV